MSEQELPPPSGAKTLRAFAPVILWFGRSFLGWNRLDHITRVDLGCTISEVVEFYDDPIKSGPDEDFPEAKQYTFQVGAFHEAVISEWNGKVCSITYWSSHAAPTPDLRCMFETYGQGVGWNEIGAGYWYYRKDEKVRLWCSAIPAIGVATAEFLEAKADAKKQAREKEGPEKSTQKRLAEALRLAKALDSIDD